MSIACSAMQMQLLLHVNKDARIGYEIWGSRGNEDVDVGLVGRHRRFGGTSCQNMDTVCFFETLVSA
jgi:hypothetical protein